MFLCVDSALPESEQGFEPAGDAGGFFCGDDTVVIGDIVVEVGVHHLARGGVVPALAVVVAEVESCAVVWRESRDDGDAAVRAGIGGGGDEFAAFRTEHDSLAF